jgi:hypothetical protein
MNILANQMSLALALRVHAPKDGEEIIRYPSKKRSTETASAESNAAAHRSSV